MIRFRISNDYLLTSSKLNSSTCTLFFGRFSDYGVWISILLLSNIGLFVLIFNFFFFFNFGIGWDIDILIELSLFDIWVGEIILFLELICDLWWIVLLMLTLRFRDCDFDFLISQLLPNNLELPLLVLIKLEL